MKPESVNRLAELLQCDRRTLRRKLTLHAVEPAGQGSSGPLYRASDAARVLFETSALDLQAHHLVEGSCDVAQAFLARVRRLKLPKAQLRAVREALAASLWEVLARIAVSDPEPQWSKLSDRNLGRALAALVRHAELPADLRQPVPAPDAPWDGPRVTSYEDGRLARRDGLAE
jgi:hypothetical protein